MTRRTAATVRAAHHRAEVEADVPASLARISRLFGDVECSGSVAPVVHTTRIQSDGKNFVFRCSCHAFGTWTTRRQAEADAKAHVEKPWRKP